MNTKILITSMGGYGSLSLVNYLNNSIKKNIDFFGTHNDQNLIKRANKICKFIAVVPSVAKNKSYINTSINFIKKYKIDFSIPNSDREVHLFSKFRKKFKSKVFCLEGDGSFLMHLGCQTLIAKSKLKNFKYILFNNKSHYSTGGNIPSNITNIKLKSFAKSIGLNYLKIKSAHDLNIFMLKKSEKNYFLDLDCNNVHFKNLPRPKLEQIKY